MLRKQIFPLIALLFCALLLKHCQLRHISVEMIVIYCLSIRQ